VLWWTLEVIWFWWHFTLSVKLESYFISRLWNSLPSGVISSTSLLLSGGVSNQSFSCDVLARTVSDASALLCSLSCLTPNASNIFIVKYPCSSMDYDTLIIFVHNNILVFRPDPTRRAYVREIDSPNLTFMAGILVPIRSVRYSNIPVWRNKSFGAVSSQCLSCFYVRVVHIFVFTVYSFVLCTVCLSGGHFNDFQCFHFCAQIVLMKRAARSLMVVFITLIK